VVEAESLIVAADMAALRFHEAAWAATERDADPPDPTSLSDRALYSILGYDERDLPGSMRDAIREEGRRRGMIVDGLERLFAVMLVAGLSAIWFVVGWLLLV
jgi:hypothetical protein